MKKCFVGAATCAAVVLLVTGCGNDESKKAEGMQYGSSAAESASVETSKRPVDKFIDADVLEPMKSNAILQKNLVKFGNFEFGSKKAQGDYVETCGLKLDKPYQLCTKANLFYTDRTDLLRTIQLEGKAPDGATKEQLKAEGKRLAAQLKADYGVELENQYGGLTWEYKDDDFIIRLWVSDDGDPIQFTVENRYAVRQAAGLVTKLAADAGKALLSDDSLASFMGFTFGALGEGEYPDKHGQSLARAFRYFDKVNLFYGNETKKLETVQLSGKAPDSFTQIDRKDECEAIGRLMGAQYNLNFKSEAFLDGWHCKYPKGLFETGDLSIDIWIADNNTCQLTVKNTGAAKSTATGKTSSDSRGL